MRTILLSVAVALAAAAPAPAATVRDAPGGRCAATTFTPLTGGLVTATLRARSGDWDLEVRDAATGRVHGRSAFSGARERVLAAATAGRPLRALACRRRGSSARARVAFDLHRAAPAPRSFPARLVRVLLDGAQALARLEALGLDVTHNHGPRHADVVLYSATELARLVGAGFLPEVRIADLRAQTARTLARPSARPLPSGQAQYRTLAEYAEQLKGIAREHPGLARTVVAGTSLEGRPIEGVELARDVDRVDDGRPAILLLGLHHAREWPSGEMPMELALDLARSHGSDPRITALLDRVRVIVIPVVNPDGFEVSRLAGPLPGDDDSFATLPLILTDTAAYKRKNCRPTAGSEAMPCATRPTVQGVDLNRNYGAFWGGVGTSTNPADQTYRGTAPYSEPESEAIHRLSATRPITMVISHHTFTDSGVWLRQPGFCRVQGDCSTDVDVVPDEAAMATLGEAMAHASGWPSQLGWTIGEITGATEDWNYFTQGAYGYTPEQRGVNFHPDFETAVVGEYPGVREALLRAAETAADPAHHAILEGSAPAGRTLRLAKAFQTPTSQPGVVVDDRLDFTMTVPAGGRFNWHVNQSTRPLAAGPEPYVLTCEGPDGTVLERRDVVVARGQALALDLPCGGPATDAGQQPGGSAHVLARVRRPSARRLNRTGRLRVRLTARNGTFRSVRVRLTRGRRTIARGSLRSLSATKAVRLRRVARARRARHRLIVTARSAGGAYRSTTLVRLRR